MWGQRLVFRTLPAARAGAAAAVTLGSLGLFEVARWSADSQKSWEVRERHVRRWARLMLAVAGVKLSLEPRVVASATRPELIVANHRSPFDIPILLSLFGGHALSRADLAGWPVIGVAARHTETLFVDRADRKSGARAIRAMRKCLELGHRVVVFPEGTTHRGDEVRPFHGGGFAAVAGLHADVIPVGLAYPPALEWEDETFSANLGRAGRFVRIAVAVCVGDPIPAAHSNGRALSDAARHAVQAQVARARRLFSTL